MGNPYVGEIRLFAGNFFPAGWAFCDGSLLPISENETLFQLIGTTYGGDGESTFAVPDLRGRTPVHVGANGYTQGTNGGVESVTLNIQQMPAHTHPPLTTSTPGASDTPGGSMIFSDMGPSGTTTTNTWKTPYDGASQVQLSAASISPVGGSQPHDNMQPYLAVYYIISLFGVYPPPN